MSYERSLLDQLLAESRLYKTSRDYQELLDFVCKLRNFAPFNAMLLQIQKPGLSHAATAKDWLRKFNREIKPHARPLIILWPFGPIALVYDVADTEGAPLPNDIFAFQASGNLSPNQLKRFSTLLKKKNIAWNWIDAGDNSAGQITLLNRRREGRKIVSNYRIDINKSHPSNVQFCTLCHELGHLFLGHLGKDHLSSAERPNVKHAQMELEAESVAYIVCQRNNVTPRSQTYLSNFVNDNASVERMDLYMIMRAAGQVEALLNLNGHTLKERSTAEASSQMALDI